jgi:thiamine-phosphate pyrophosphorylase
LAIRRRVKPMVYNGGMRSRLPTVWWMTDDIRTPDPRAILARLPRASAVILRHYGDSARARLAADLAALCRRYGLTLMVSGDWRLGAKVGARGLHLAEHLARRGPGPGARLWLRRGRRLLTAAAHGARGLARAGEIGADAALLSPVFATASHANVPGLGVTRAALMARGARLPVMALGGVTRLRAHALTRRGFAGMAGIGFMGEG